MLKNEENKRHNFSIENTEALIEAANNGNEEAFNYLVNNNTGLVVTVAKRFLNRGAEMEDLMQIGYIGLCKAIKRYDVAFNVKFSTYAVSLIIGEIKRHFRDHGSMIKVSRNLKELAGKIAAATEELHQEGYIQPTISDISKKLSIPPQEIANALAAAEKPVYFSDMMFNKDGEENQKETREMSEDFNEEKVIFNIQLKGALDTLNEREKQILIDRYILDKTQKEIAEAIGVSQVHISRLEKKALIALREQM